MLIIWSRYWHVTGLCWNEYISDLSILVTLLKLEMSEMSPSEHDAWTRIFNYISLKMILHMIRFAWNSDEVLLLFKTIMNHQFVCWIFTHPSCNTDNMICPERIKDIYYLKIECTSEAQTQWCIGTWPQTSISRPDSVEELQKEDWGSGFFVCFFFLGCKCGWALQWNCSTLTH